MPECVLECTNRTTLFGLETPRELQGAQVQEVWAPRKSIRMRSRQTAKGLPWPAKPIAG